MAAHPDMRRGLQRAPALALVSAGAVSVQFGAAFATGLFGRVGPAGAVTLRLGFAAVVLLVGTSIARHHRHAGSPHHLPDPAAAPQLVRPPITRSDRLVVCAFGLVLAAMNLSFYGAISRVPLGVAVTVEFVGPLALALFSSRRLADGLWALAAGAGVVLLSTSAGRHVDPVGIGLAGLAGACWAGYILLSKETGRRFASLDGLASAMGVGALAVVPLGIAAGGAELVRPAVLSLGAAVAVLSSVVPYSLELLALRRVSPRAFGVMMSLDPALAAAAGFAVLGQQLALREWAALGLVVAANIGNSLSASRR